MKHRLLRLLVILRRLYFYLQRKRYSVSIFWTVPLSTSAWEQRKSEVLSIGWLWNITRNARLLRLTRRWQVKSGFDLLWDVIPFFLWDFPNPQAMLELQVSIEQMQNPFSKLHKCTWQIEATRRGYMECCNLALQLLRYLTASLLDGEWKHSVLWLRQREGHYLL